MTWVINSANEEWPSCESQFYVYISFIQEMHFEKFQQRCCPFLTHEHKTWLLKRNQFFPLEETWAKWSVYFTHALDFGSCSSILATIEEEKKMPPKDRWGTALASVSRMHHCSHTFAMELSRKGSLIPNFSVQNSWSEVFWKCLKNAKTK